MFSLGVSVYERRWALARHDSNMLTAGWSLAAAAASKSAGQSSAAAMSYSLNFFKGNESSKVAAMMSTEHPSVCSSNLSSFDEDFGSVEIKCCAHVSQTR